jgi:hypothetical protein
MPTKRNDKKLRVTLMEEQISIFDYLIKDMTEQEKCDSDANYIQCANCNCWKINLTDDLFDKK